MIDNPKILKWFEVTWVTASGRSLVRAEGEGEARMLACNEAEGAWRERRGGEMPEGKFIAHQWFGAADNEPLIFDVEELAEDTAMELKRDMEDG